MSTRRPRYSSRRCSASSVEPGYSSVTPAKSQNSGDFKAVQVGRWPLLMTRHSDGLVRVLFNVCRHRGSKVCYETRPSATRTRSCACTTLDVRHGRQAECRPDARPHERPRHQLIRLVNVARVETHRDFVFASLSPEGPTLAEHLGKGAYYLDVMTDRALDREIIATSLSATSTTATGSFSSRTTVTTITPGSCTTAPSWWACR